MIELNKVMLVGRLTRDPEYRSTSTGRSVANFSLAVNRRSYNREAGSYQDDTAFVDCECWERQAEFVKNYLHKGSGIFVEGRLKQDTWQDRETGANRSKLKVVAERINFAESKAEAERSAARGGDDHPAQPQRAAAPAEDRGRDFDDGGDETHDDLPF